MEIIGLSGYACSGKTTIAKLMVEKHGFECIAFADAMRNMLYATNPIIVLIYEEKFREVTRLQQLVDALGWDQAKVEYPEIRELLQRFGTEGGRKFLGEDVWVETLFKNAKTDRIVIPDVRFPNEAKAIRDRGGEIIRVKRTGVGPVNGHQSETLLEDDWNASFNNDGTPEDALRTIGSIIGGWD
jgi:hypothetical protein